MEAMSVESIIQAYWQRKNYFTIPRYSFIKKGINKKGKNSSGYSDIDLLAFKTKQGIYHGCQDNNDRDNSILVLCESKAHGEKNEIKFDDYSKPKFEDFNSLKDEDLDALKDDSTQHDLVKFYFNVRYILENESLNTLIDLSTLDKLKLQFVSTALFCNETEILNKIKNNITKLFKHKYKPYNKKFEVELEITTHFDIINKLFLLVRKDESGKRYGNMILDFVRELNRYISVSECTPLSNINDIDGAVYYREKDEKPAEFKKRKLYALQKVFKTELANTFDGIDEPCNNISKKIK